MTETVSIADAGLDLGALVRRAADGDGRIALTDAGGRTAAVLLSPDALANLEDGRAYAEYQAKTAAGTVETVPHDAVRKQLLGNR